MIYYCVMRVSVSIHFIVFFFYLLERFSSDVTNKHGRHLLTKWRPFHLTKTENIIGQQLHYIT